MFFLLTGVMGVRQPITTHLVSILQLLEVVTKAHVLQSVMQDKVVIVSDQEVQVAGALVVHQVDGGAEYLSRSGGIQI